MKRKKNRKNIRKREINNRKKSTSRNGTLKNGLKYKRKGNYVEIFGPSYYTNRLVIPDKVNGKIVKKIILDDIIAPYLRAIIVNGVVQVEFHNTVIKNIRKITINRSKLYIYSKKSDLNPKCKIELNNKTIQYLSNSGFFYNRTINGLIITGCKDELKIIKIPDKMNGVRVIGVEEKSFHSKGIREVIFPKNIEFIRERAFSNNQIEKLNISNSVTFIGEEAFNYNRIKNLNLSNSLKKIECRVFANNQLTSLNIPDNIIEIKSGAFVNNKLNNLNLSNKIKFIEGEAFQNNSISEISLPNSLRELDYTSFASNPSHIKIYGSWLTKKDGLNFHSLEKN